MLQSIMRVGVGREAGGGGHLLIPLEAQKLHFIFLAGSIHSALNLA